MKFLSFFALTCCLYVFSINSSHADFPGLITLKTTQEFADAKKFSAVTDALSSKITSCMGTGASNEQCLCAETALVSKYKATYLDVISRHPEWKGKGTFYTNEQGLGVSTSFPGHQKQYERLQTLTCN